MLIKKLNGVLGKNTCTVVLQAFLELEFVLRGVKRAGDVALSNKWQTLKDVCFAFLCRTV